LSANLRAALKGAVRVSCLVAFSHPATTSKSLIPVLDFSRLSSQSGGIPLKFTVPDKG
jgi:hypothetical protein